MTSSGAIVLEWTKPLAGRGWLLAAGLAVQTTLGALFSWSVFLEPLRNAYGWDQGSLLTPYRYTLVWFTIGLFLAKQIAPRKSPRTLTRMGGMLMISGSLLAAFGSENLTVLVVGIGVLCGFGAGLAWVAPVSAFQSWLPERRGLFIAIATLCFGVGSLLAAPLLNWVIGPDAELLARSIPAALLALTILFGVGVLGAGEMLPSSRAWLAPHVLETLRGNPQSIAESDRRTWRRGVMPLLRLWLQWTVFFVGAFAGLVALQPHLPILGSLRWHEAWLATGVCVAVIAVANWLGRGLWGAVTARFGRPGTLFGLLALSVSLSLIATSGRLSYDAVAAFLALIGFGFGGFLGLMPSLAGEMLPRAERVSFHFGVMFSACGLSAFAAPFWLYAQQPQTFLGSVSLLSLSAALLAGFVYLLLHPTENASPVSQAISRW